ncbi:hypothetical protein SKAU_G00141880 [Synaphobranchus kaupii]|uniref:Uncharacterized protein n=1 Tax=Synaphobranchus kaupii TaxID=118154 RepID=A0A9Q1J283_SYNKA|nr:hypothetical protein SKAU_G00141880 [Synaphobranchus kaupii]
MNHFFKSQQRIVQIVSVSLTLFSFFSRGQVCVEVHLQYMGEGNNGEDSGETAQAWDSQRQGRTSERRVPRLPLTQTPVNPLRDEKRSPAETLGLGINGSKREWIPDVKCMCDTRSCF